jgi:hypothetical protein
MSNLKMIHPEIDAVADAGSIEGYNAVWAPRGWVLLGAPEAFATEVLGQPVKDVEKLKVEELKSLHAARGLVYPSSSVLKDELVKTFRDTFADAVPVDGTGAPAVVADPASPDEAAALAAAEAAEAAKLNPAVVATPAALAGRSTSSNPDTNKN